MDVGEHLADLVADDAGQRHTSALDGHHLDPELAQRRRHLRADEAESHHHRAASARDGGADAIAILDGAQLEDAGEIRARYGQGPIAPARGDQQPIVGDALAALELDELLRGVDLRCPGPELERDALLGVVARWLDQLVLEAVLPAQVALRQRRSVVG